jgi:uncharacterized membrane protein YhaH (DUF805 family)
MIRDILLAIALPTRRLPLWPYILIYLGCIVGIAHLHMLLLAMRYNAEPIYGLPFAVYLGLIWTAFCVLSNRLHDGGVGAPWLAPIFLVGIVAFASLIDPFLLGDDRAVQELWTSRLQFVRTFLGFGSFAVLGVTLYLPSHGERNRFGMPCGERAGRISACPDSHYLSNEPSMHYNQPVSKDRRLTRTEVPPHLERRRVVRTQS